MCENDLVFNSKVGRNKTAIQSPGCPFCNTDELNGIIDTNQGIILLKNKFATLIDTTQLVLIESAKHDGEISNYGSSEWLEILQYALKQWQKIQNTHEYRSVLLYKNFGKLSGGSQAHPHMQIVGLKNSDGYAEVKDSNFTGTPVVQLSGATGNISDHPIMGFLEFNVTWKNEDVKIAAEMIRQTVKYILTGYYKGRCESYNLFFYQNRGQYVCKIVPRFVDSPYFVGYKIPQKFNAERVQELIQEYLTFCDFSKN